MISHPRRLGLAAVSSIVLAIVGCGEDNEKAVKDQASATAGKAGDTKPTPPMQTQADYAKQQQIQGAGTGKGSGYPGAK